MSKEKNEYNLQQISNVWYNLENSFQASDFSMKQDYMMAALGYQNGKSGLSQLLARLKHYTIDKSDEYDKLYKVMTKADHLVTVAGIEDINLDSLWDEEQIQIPKEEPFVCINTFLGDDFETKDILNAGFLSDVLVVAEGSPVYLKIPEDPEYMCLSSIRDCAVKLTELRQRYSNGETLSQFELYVLYILLDLIKKDKLVFPLMFTGSKYFNREDGRIVIGGCNTGNYVIKEAYASAEQITLANKVTKLADYTVYTSLIKDYLGTKYKCFYIED